MPSFFLFCRTVAPVLLGLSSLLHCSCKASKSKHESFLTNYVGFQQAKKTDSQIVYTRGMSRLAYYDKVFIEEVVVFPPEKNKKGKVTQADLQRIRDLFEGSLRSEIANNTRASLTNGPGPQTLSLRAGVFDLQPGKPAVFAMGYAPYVGLAATATKAVTDLNMGAGSATIEMELIDSVTREQLFAIVDQDAGSKLQIIKGFSRWGHIEAALKEWSKNLRVNLQEAQGLAPPGGGR